MNDCVWYCEECDEGYCEHCEKAVIIDGNSYCEPCAENKDAQAHKGEKND